MTTITPVARSRAVPPSEASSPIKSILRKPASVLGTRSREDSDDELGSPTKKQKRSCAKTVVFDETLNRIRPIGLSNMASLQRQGMNEEVGVVVKNALDDRAMGDNEGYDTLKDLFVSKTKGASTDDEDEDDEPSTRPQDLIPYLSALSRHVSLLGKSHCSGLVRTILKYDWLGAAGQDEMFAKVYIQFLADLSNSQGSYLAQVIDMMIDKFRRFPYSTRSGTGSREGAKDWLHRGLRFLLEKFPAATQITLDVIQSRFPFSGEGKKIHMEYVDNLLELKHYRPVLDRDIMELITSKVVALDVGMLQDLEDADDETTKAILQQLDAPRANEDEDNSDADSVVSDETDDDEQLTRIVSIRTKVETMDAILDRLFALYAPIFSAPESAEAETCFQDILSDFVNVVLPAYKSRFTQFVVFHFAQTSERLMDMFIGTLLNIVVAKTETPIIVRQSAVAYLASFAARAALVSTDQIKKIVGTFLDYMDHYRTIHEPGCRGPDIRRYSTFYSFTQGLLYIFCFRWRDLVDENATTALIDRDDPATYTHGDVEWLGGMRMRFLASFYSKLNPLKVCAPVIVQEFVNLARYLNFLYLFPLLERNKTVQLTQFMIGNYSTGGALRDTGYDPRDEFWTHLEPVFPFDPYQLPLSRQWLNLADTYLSWQSIPGLDRDMDDDSVEGDVEKGMDDDDVEEDTATDDENDN